MKHSLPLRFLCITLFSFSIGYGSVACLATGLDLNVSLAALALVCAVAATLAASCFCRKRDTLILSGLYLIVCVIAALTPSFRQKIGSIIHLSAERFQLHYGTPVPQWTESLTAQSHLLSLLVVAGGIMLAVVLTVTYQRSSFLVLLAALVPICLCIFTPDTMPDVVPLLILLSGLLLFLLSQSARSRDIDQGNVLSVFLLIPVCTAIILLAILVPPDRYHQSRLYISMNRVMNMLDAQPSDPGVPSVPEVPPTIGTQPSDVDLSQLGNRTEIDVSVMKVTTNYTGTLYIRDQDFDVYTGLGWQSSGDRVENDWGLAPIWRDAPEFITIYLSQTQDRYFLPCYPTQAPELVGGISPNPDASTQYTLSHSRIRPDWRTFWYECLQNKVSAPDVPAVDDRYLSLPEGTSDRASVILSQLSISPDADPLAAADIICKYVSDSARYSTSPSKMPQTETDFSMWFLESADTGYCTHFASAAVVLLRAAGIPARYVEGYLVQTEQSQDVTVRQNMSHAWVECYLDYVGWVIMDPTPSSSNTPSVPTTPSDPPAQTTPPEDTPPSETAPDTTTPGATSPSDQPAQTTPPEDTTPSETAPGTTTPGATIPNTQPPTVTSPTGSSSTPNVSVPPQNDPMDPSAQTIRESGFLAGLIWVVCCLAALLLQWAARRLWITLWLRKGSGNAKAIRLYRYSRYLARALKAKYPSQLEKLANKAAFSSHQLDKGEINCFSNYIASQTKAIRTLPLYRRMVLRFVFAVC
jgi:hypothetical protein